MSSKILFYLNIEIGDSKINSLVAIIKNLRLSISEVLLVMTNMKLFSSLYIFFRKDILGTARRGKKRFGLSLTSCHFKLSDNLQSTDSLIDDIKAMFNLQEYLRGTENEPATGMYD